MSSFRSSTSVLRRNTWPWILAAVALTCVLALGLPRLAGGAGSTADTDADAGDVPSQLMVPPPPPGADGSSPGTRTGEPREPKVVSWGGYGDQLAVVIENDTDLEVVRARVLVTALSKTGTVLATSTGGEATTCCTVLSLRPGGSFGVFLDLPARAGGIDEVTQVVVRYVEIETAEPGPDDEAWVKATSGELRQTATDTVVTASLETHGSAGAFVVGQAYLVDGEDRLVGVISGRFYCFTPGEPRQVRMQLLRPTPPGTRIQTVQAVPVPEGASPGVPHDCP